MSKFPFTKGAALFAALTIFTTTAHAEVTFSTSANPNVMFEEDMADGFGSYNGQNAADIVAGLDESIWEQMPAAPELDLSDMMTPDFLRGMPEADGGKEWACLTEALYFEARGEELKGIFAVADVILNRVESKRYPDSVCGVVHQGTGEKWMCQFSYFCDGEPEFVAEPGAWKKVAKIARIMLDAEDRDLTAGATHYHTKAVNPYWAKVFPRVTTIGYHHFYRET